jgi:hypothetical protein
VSRGQHGRSPTVVGETQFKKEERELETKRITQVMSDGRDRTCLQE